MTFTLPKERKKYYKYCRCCGFVVALHTADRAEGGLNKALQLTIERNGPCDWTMNGTLSIAKLALAERMHRLGCPCTAEAEGRLASERNTERKKTNNPKQYKLTHSTRIPFLEIELNFKVETTRKHTKICAFAMTVTSGIPQSGAAPAVKAMCQ